jgi:hypothetical protein
MDGIHPIIPGLCIEQLTDTQKKDHVQEHLEMLRICAALCGTYICSANTFIRIYLSICPSVHPSAIYPSIHPSAIYPCISLYMFMYIHVFDYTFIHICYIRVYREKRYIHTHTYIYLSVYVCDCVYTHAMHRVKRNHCVCVNVVMYVQIVPSPEC